MELNEKEVKTLYSKVESFISNLQVGEDDENMSEVDEASQKVNEDNDDDLAENQMKKKRKKSKNTNNNHRNILPV